MAALGDGEHYAPVLQGDLAWDAWAGPDKLGTWKVEDLIQFVRGLRATRTSRRFVTS